MNDANNNPVNGQSPILYLASQSPRRAELLRQLNLDFHVISSEIDESVRAAESADVYVQRMAEEKAQAGLAVLTASNASIDPTNTVILAADTAVVCDGAILGKPADESDAVAMLRRLSGRSHQVMTGVSVWAGMQNKVKNSVNQTAVTFRTISEAEVQWYWRSGEPRDKAGGYGIQGLGAIFVQRIEGSYSSVVGLPLMETSQLLRQAGISVLVG